MVIKKTVFKTTLVYYSISLCIYILELAVFYTMIKINLFEVVQLNYLVRLIACVIAGIIYKNLLFEEVKDFYLIYSASAIFIPIFATILLFLGEKFVSTDILLLKLLADIFASFVGYFFLQSGANMNTRRTK